MRTVISVPDDLFRNGERVAKRLKLSRSQLYRRALAQFLQRHDARAITAALNEVHSAADDSGRLDPVLQRLQRATFSRVAW